MPRYPIDRATNFIVEKESWTVVEYDHTSVPGVIYLSMTEGKINLIYDDVENNIADTNKIAKYEFEIPSEKQTFSIGDTIELKYTLTKDGIPIEKEVEFISQNKQIIKDINGVLTAVGNGETDVIMRLKDQPTVMNTIHIEIGGEAIFSAYIEGAETIRLSRESIYKLVGFPAINGNVSYSINNTELATIIEQNNNECKIHANEKNLLGSCILTATFNGAEYTKVLTIIPLW